MKRIGLFSLLFLLLLAVASSTFVFSQNGGRKVSDPPFAVGETLTFEGKINKFAVSVTIGDMTLEVVDPAADGRFQFKADARSRGTMLKLLKYSFQQEIDAVADARDLRSIS